MRETPDVHKVCDGWQVVSSCIIDLEFTFQISCVSLPFGQGLTDCSHYPNTLTGHCLLTEMANQPITWQQLNAFRHVEVVKTTCWCSNRASELGRKDLSDFAMSWPKNFSAQSDLVVFCASHNKRLELERGMLVPDRLVWVFQKLLIWDSRTQPV